MAHGSEHLITASARSLLGDPANYSGGLQDLGDGVYAWLQPNGGFGESNCGLIVAENESAVIDTCWDHTQAQRFLNAAQSAIQGAQFATSSTHIPMGTTGGAMR